MTSQPMVLFVGPRNSGKATAIASISDTPVISVPVDEAARVEAPRGADSDAVTFGQLQVAGEGMIRLCGMTGPDSGSVRTPLEQRADGLVLLVDGRAADADTVLDDMLDRYGDFCRQGSAVVGITRTNVDEDACNLQRYQNSVQRDQHAVPVYLVDARDRVQILVLLASLVEMLRLRTTEKSAQ